MTGSQKILLSGGLALAILGMAYGFWYAVADEHPTLERMGVSLASAFAEVAKGEMDPAREFLKTYGETQSVGLYRTDPALSGVSSGLRYRSPAAGVLTGNHAQWSGPKGRGAARCSIPYRGPGRSSSRSPAVH